jgi:hypothetical protein
MSLVDSYDGGSKRPEIDFVDQVTYHSRGDLMEVYAWKRARSRRRSAAADLRAKHRFEQCSGSCSVSRAQERGSGGDAAYGDVTWHGSFSGSLNKRSDLNVLYPDA